ncbi:MAG: hypothetical protein JWR66_1300 [Modestobacter sp.]|jgi:hypothetical protein|nr:hypothetical protein [Modestobacter sp.]MCW2575270.1 hypothetical protein [Modestobacter sp.]
MRALLVALGTLGVLLVGAVPASADPPVTTGDRITDTAGALGADRSRVQSALDQAQHHGITIWVVLVPGFDAPDGTDWAAATAAQSKLPNSDMLFALDVTHGSYQWWIGDSFPLPDTDVDGVLTSQVDPFLGTRPAADVVVALANGLTPGNSTFLGGPAQQSPWSGTTTALVGGILVVTLGGAHLLSRRGTTAPTPQ